MHYWVCTLYAHLYQISIKQWVWSHFYLTSLGHEVHRLLQQEEVTKGQPSGAIQQLPGAPKEAALWFLGHSYRLLTFQTVEEGCSCVSCWRKEKKNQNKQQSNMLIKGVPHAGWERCSQGSKSPSQNKSITSELRRRKKSMVNLRICKHVFIYLCPYDKCSQEETLLAKFLTLFSASSST